MALFSSSAADIASYQEARKKGLREYRHSISAGRYPYPPVLDEMVEGINSLPQIPVGLVEIPLEDIAGTKTSGRTNVFSESFYPILKESSEFAYKWAALYASAAEEGIKESIKVYEFMNRFYVEEGNKRVSVSRVLDYSSIWANVTRIMPKRSDEKANRVYYEFCDFYKVCPLYLFHFSEEGCCQKFAELLGQSMEKPWSKDTLNTIKASFAIFQTLYRAKGGDALPITEGDAFLTYLTFYSLDSLLNESRTLLNSRLDKLWNEFLTKDDSIRLVITPEDIRRANTIGSSLMDLWSHPRNYTESSPLKIAFLYARNQENSSWTYGHELGRNDLQNKFEGIVQTSKYPDCRTEDETRSAIDAAVADGNEMIFTTAPTQMRETLRSAIHYPDVKFLNCSINLSSQAVRTYYGRMHEAKFLMGALAASVSSNHRIGYVADYPIFGTPASVNAFAIGAAMLDPKAQIYLAWSTKKGGDWQQEFRDRGIYIISGPDLIKPQEASRAYGLYTVDTDGIVTNLAAPVWNWGRYYELIVRTVLDGSWDAKGLVRRDQALNYWWGMEAGVIDVILPEKLPYYSRKMIQTLRNGIVRGDLSPFDGELHSQEGLIKPSDSERLTNEDIIHMSWLNDNVTGSLPKAEELNEEAQATISVSGITESAAPGKDTVS